MARGSGLLCAFASNRPGFLDWRWWQAPPPRDTEPHHTEPVAMRIIALMLPSAPGRLPGGRLEATPAVVRPRFWRASQP